MAVTARKKRSRATKQHSTPYLPDDVLLTLVTLLDPLSFLAFARTSHRQLCPTFFAKPPTLLCLPDEILPLVSDELPGPANRALALTCRRLLPIARAHTWFQAGATKQDTSRILTQIKAKKFKGELLRRLVFEAMDAASPDDPPPVLEFFLFVRLIPYLPNLNQLAIYTLPTPDQRGMQEIVISALFKLDNLVELELGGWDVGECWNPPLRVKFLYPLFPHLLSPQSLHAIVQGRDHWEKFEAPHEIVACRATDVRIRFEAPATDEELLLLAQHTFPNALSLSPSTSAEASPPPASSPPSLSPLPTSSPSASPASPSQGPTSTTSSPAFPSSANSPSASKQPPTPSSPTFLLVSKSSSSTLSTYSPTTFQARSRNSSSHSWNVFVPSPTSCLSWISSSCVMCTEDWEDYVKEETREAIKGRRIALSVVTSAPSVR